MCTIGREREALARINSCNTERVSQNSIKLQTSVHCVWIEHQSCKESNQALPLILLTFYFSSFLFKSKNDFLKLNHQLSFQDDITSTDDSCCESNCESNEENFLVPNQQNHQKLQPPPPIMTAQRNHDSDNKQQMFIQTQNQKINEKMLDNQKLLLESLSNLPQNLLQSWIQSGQLQVSVDDGKS